MSPTTTAILTLAQADAQAPPDKSLFDYVAAGGPVGVIIIVLSLVGVGLIVAQLLTIRLSRVAPPETAEGIARRLDARDINAAIEFCVAGEPRQSPLARVVGLALRRTQRSSFGVLELQTAVEEIGGQEMARLGRATDAVHLVAVIAPMLGLLGTVVGMVGAFDVIAQTDGPVRPDSLAGDISQALITTVLGLIVAIPATAMHTYLRNRIDAVAVGLAEIIEEVIAPLQGGQAGARPAASTPAPRPAEQAAGQPASQPSAQPAGPGNGQHAMPAVASPAVKASVAPSPQPAPQP